MSDKRVVHLGVAEYMLGVTIALLLLGMGVSLAHIADALERAYPAQEETK